MSPDTELDRILASLAEPLGLLSDTLLDLRQWARSPARAGSCVKAYFELVGEAPATREVSQSLATLRKWLEARLNIIVIDGARGVPLESLPLALAGETDLAEFCQAAMRRMRDDRCHAAPHLRLEFGFSRDFAQAA